jgi:transcription termination/antitermination protein NusA
MEVPEIYDGTVQIRAVAREAGERTKIAVESRDKDVDPVGACVGMKGMRVQSIIRELRGEKIDIIPYNEDILLFAQKALSPAKVTRVQAVDMEEKRLEVIVEDTQLSLAIGKKGQNVRLASKLIGWNIDIKSEEEKRREVEAQMSEMTVASTSLNELQGVGPKTTEKLEAHGVTSIEKLADMTPEQLLEIPGIGEKMVEKIRVSVEQYFQALELQQTAAPEETAPELVAAEETAAPVKAVEDSFGVATESETAIETETSQETTEGLPEEVESAPESVETESAAEIPGTSEQEQQRSADEHDGKTDADPKSLKTEDNA